MGSVPQCRAKHSSLGSCAKVAEKSASLQPPSRPPSRQIVLRLSRLPARSLLGSLLRRTLGQPPEPASLIGEVLTLGRWQFLDRRGLLIGDGNSGVLFLGQKHRRAHGIAGRAGSLSPAHRLGPRTEPSWGGPMPRARGFRPHAPFNICGLAPVAMRCASRSASEAGRVVIRLCAPMLASAPAQA